MAPPVGDLAALGPPDHEGLGRDERGSRSDVLYGLLRREQAIAASGGSSPRQEVSRILDFGRPPPEMWSVCSSDGTTAFFSCSRTAAPAATFVLGKCRTQISYAPFDVGHSRSGRPDTSAPDRRPPDRDRDSYREDRRQRRARFERSFASAASREDCMSVGVRLKNAALDDSYTASRR